MTRIERSVIIQSPVDGVFAYAADWQTWHQWFVGVSNVRPTAQIIQGTGARYAYKVRIMCFSAGVETEIHDFVPNRGWTGVATRGITARTQWIFEPVEEGTKFTYAMEYDLPVPLLGPLVDSLLTKPQWKKIIEQSMDNLRRHFEAKAAD
jgi:coenzyme Q-binding protein COQ10